MMNISPVNYCIRWVLTWVLLSSSNVFGASPDRLISTQKSLYRDVMVYENDDQRCMKFSVVLTQGCIDLKDPNRMVLEYYRMLLTSLYLKPNPQRILVIGLGCGVLPRSLSQLLPNAEIDIVELDPSVVESAKAFFGFKKSENMRVHLSDGRIFVKREALKRRVYDLVVLDAFDQNYVPEHMVTVEFLREIKGLLSTNGILAANTFSKSGLFNSETNTYLDVFGSVFSLKSNNRVLLASNGPLPEMTAVEHNAAALERHFLPFMARPEALLSMFKRLGHPVPGARRLTDRYAPANLMQKTVTPP